ncbi:hypothetical protein HSEST_2276 [Halapricum desulfuricans]|uniref:Uncharacterized protein n=1 Tax=Halapricum desulfuricans TaxID=2841257 RepID=A0A897NSK2_9EURY|nr:hypothetical protein HSEST_2276 [Halapricum desulfuricans]
MVLSGHWVRLVGGLFTPFESAENETIFRERTPRGSVFRKMTFPRFDAFRT